MMMMIRGGRRRGGALRGGGPDGRRDELEGAGESGGAVDEVALPLRGRGRLPVERDGLRRTPCVMLQLLPLLSAAPHFRDNGGGGACVSFFCPVPSESERKRGRSGGDGDGSSGRAEEPRNGGRPLLAKRKEKKGYFFPPADASEPP